MAADAKGRFVWYECMTGDPVTAEAFYREVVGWGRTVWEGGDEPYVMFTKGDAPLAGLMQLPEEAEEAGTPPHWLGYIHVPEIHAYTQKAESMGARKLFGPHAVPEIGTMTVLADPQGAPFALYQPETDPEHLPATTEPGDVSWHEHMTGDREKAFDFYSELVGWEKTAAIDMGEMGLYQMFGSGDFELGGMMAVAAEMEVPHHWLYYFQVGDLDAAVQAVEREGGQVMNGPMEVPDGDRVAACVDPTGAAFGLHQRVG